MSLFPYSTIFFRHIVGTQVFVQRMVIHELIENTVQVIFSYSNSFIQQYPLKSLWSSAGCLEYTDHKELTVKRRKININKSSEASAEKAVTITYHVNWKQGEKQDSWRSPGWVADSCFKKG